MRGQVTNLTFDIQQQIPPTNTLRPIILDNACPLRITAAAGTKLAGASSQITVIILICERILQPTYSKLQIFFAFLIHAVSLDQAFAHCPKFLTAG